MKKHILVIEGYPLAADFLRLVLEHKGYQVTTAKTPSEAMEALDRGKKYAAITIDGRLGSEAYDTEPVIKRAIENECSPIRIAASSDPRIREQMLEDGCTDSSQEDTKRDIPDLISRLVPIPATE